MFKMKKLDELFKKVELFEKLALYGDRSSFLEALANSNPDMDSSAKTLPKSNTKKP